MENDWSGTLQNNNIICIFTQKIKLFQLNKYDPCWAEIIYFSQKYANDVIDLDEFPSNHFQLNDTYHSLIG